MAPNAALIASLTVPPEESLLHSLPAAVEWLEVRADLVGEIDPAWLRGHFAGKLLYTLRSRAEGGGFEGSSARRRQRLQAAAPDWDLVDLELQRDLDNETLGCIPASKRVISWHGQGREVEGLRRLLQRAEEAPAALYKFVPTPREAREELAPLQLLSELRRKDVLAFAGGSSGVWTRLLAARLGAPLLYGSIGDHPAAPGQPTIEQLIGDYCLPEQPEIEFLAGIVGNPVGHSLSPRIHNNSYRLLGIPGLYLPFEPESFSDFWLEVVEGKLLDRLGLRFAALSVTAPFKHLAVAVAGAASPLSKSLESANTLIQRGEVWEAETTDGDGVCRAIARSGAEIAGRRCAVLGAGGAGRAAIAGLASCGGDVVLANRTEETGRAAAQRLGIEFVALKDLRVGDFDVVVNATSLGHGAGDSLPLEIADLKPGATVLDLVYGRTPTRLLRAAAERGDVVVVDGREVLLQQAAVQFELMTGQALPEDECRARLGLGGAS